MASREKNVPTLKTAVTVGELITSKCCKMLHQCTVQLKLNYNSRFMNCLSRDPVGVLQEEDDTEKQIKSQSWNEDSISRLQHEVRPKAPLNRFKMFFWKPQQMLHCSYFWYRVDINFDSLTVGSYILLYHQTVEQLFGRWIKIDESKVLKLWNELLTCCDSGRNFERKHYLRSSLP